MTTYAFETITADEAQNIQPGDYLTLASGPAARASVFYLPETAGEPARIQVSIGDRSVVFGQNIADLSLRGAFEVRDGSRLVIGNDDRQTVGGSPLSDAIYGGAGHDVVHAGGGDDLVQGNSGNDTLHGDAGSNTIYGGQGDDLIYAASAVETRGSWAHGNKGDDFLVGGGGDDTLLGGQGNDFIGGASGSDYLSGDLGDDELHSGSGNDTVVGGAGNDLLDSSDGADSISGGDGADVIVAYGFGRATLDGGAGDDTLVAATDAGARLFGGEGRDRFEIVAGYRPSAQTDHVIADWQSGDSIHFVQVSTNAAGAGDYAAFVSGSYDHALAFANAQIARGARYAAAQVGNDVIVFADTDGDLEDGADAAVIITGRTLTDISLINFV